MKSNFLTFNIFPQKTRYLFYLVLLLSLGNYFAQAQSKQPDRYNGFDISNASIPINEIFHGDPAKDGIPALIDTVANQKISVQFDTEHRTGIVMDKTGKKIPAHIMYWFAWYGFNPTNDIFQVKTLD